MTLLTYFVVSFHKFLPVPRNSPQDALAPYKHIEEDLKSLKEVLEMKNQQIHQQELKISELEKIVGFKFLLNFTAAAAQFIRFIR